ncbi:ketoacyl-ACP synthase III family protein [Salinispora arenicola]|uniref:3-Oxoacyl-(Acyl-carrier-protein (ACP)) synthase III domain protein n=1 Tax=Salinispora arenicola (strain CNS-205) TaxID=391037 RepID=A8LZN7_SALAI|nr:ketoacyl-ACP synthase III family protein [Salinispora arenicola]
MRTAGTYIRGIGAYLPETVTVEHAVAQGWYPEEDIDTHDLGGAAVAGDLPAPEMALRAAQDALKTSDLSRRDIDLLLYAAAWHQGPEGWIAHAYLQHYLLGGVPRASEIRQGCNGMFTMLELAASYLKAVPERTAAMLVAADNYGTPLLDRWRTNLGFILGDAATAVVLSTERGFAELLSVCSITVPEAEEVHRGGEPLFPPGATLGKDLDFGARLFYHITAQTPVLAVLGEAQETMTTVAEQALSEAGIDTTELTRVSFMNYSREVVEQRCMAPLGLGMEKSTFDFGRMIGHCGASDHLLALHHLLRTGELAAGDHVLWLAMGPGVEFTAAVLRIVHTPDGL